MLNPKIKAYYAFLNIEKEYKLKSIDIQELKTKISDIFFNHPELIVGFNTFMTPAQSEKSTIFAHNLSKKRSFEGDLIEK